jgi:hypothetical protein
LPVPIRGQVRRPRPGQPEGVKVPSTGGENLSHDVPAETFQRKGTAVTASTHAAGTRSTHEAGSARSLLLTVLGDVVLPEGTAVTISLDQIEKRLSLVGFNDSQLDLVCCLEVEHFLANNLLELNRFNCTIKTSACLLVAMLAIELQRQRTLSGRLQTQGPDSGLIRKPLQLLQQQRAASFPLKVRRNADAPQFGHLRRDSLETTQW